MPGLGPLSLTDQLAGFGSAMEWLHDHGVEGNRIASLFGTSSDHVRQLRRRSRITSKRGIVDPYLVDPLSAPADLFHSPDRFLRKQLGVRLDEDSVVLDKSGRKRQEILENEIETLGTRFWSGVRYGRGLKSLTSLREKIGYPSHYLRVRLHARLQQIIAETHVHGGRSASALMDGLKALHLSRIAYHEGRERQDLEQMARTALLLSQAHLLRWEPATATFYLDLHKRASEAAGKAIGAEAHRQLGAMYFQLGQDEKAAREFQKAMEVLSDEFDYGRTKQEHEVLNIGIRQMNLLAPVDWDGSQQLFDYMLQHLSAGDIHISMNLNWTVACGFNTDSPQAQQRAQDLLYQYPDASEGYGHQATIYQLLKLTPDLPANLRPLWVRRALYENAFRNK